MKKSLLASLFLTALPFITWAQEAVQETAPMGLDDKINEAFMPIADAWEAFVLWGFNIGNGISLPLVLILLIGGATLFTLAFSFVNIRRFGLAIQVVRGKYDDIEGVVKKPLKSKDVHVNVVDGDLVDTIKDEGHIGEVNHFQALATAVSGTVGLGNIGGVAVAIVMGGPGATFWMILAGLLGMSSKFVECTLGVKYRDIGPDGTVYGGPMYYLSKGLREIGMGGFGKVMAGLFAILCIGASFGGGNMFQANQATQQVVTQFGIQSGAAGTILGVVIAAFVGLVIIGGIKRIANVTEKIVPFMAILYVAAALAIILMNISHIGSAFAHIFSEAFNPSAVAGGFVGVLITGFRRAAFSNEAGAGSAAIAHSAVETKFPASEGIVALLEPFIDTVVICTMTALVIVITGSYESGSLNGVDLTSTAFESSIPGSSYVLTIAIFLFAFSTMISWSYYGMQSWLYLFGRTKTNELIYKVLFLLFVVLGAAATLDAVIKFSDAMILALVFPNMIGLILLFPKVKQELNSYLAAIRQSKA